MNRLKELREGANKSQRDIAEMLGISNQAYSLIENEQRGIKRKYLEKLANYYDVSVDYIFYKTEKRNIEMTELDEMKKLFNDFCLRAEEIVKKYKIQPSNKCNRCDGEIVIRIYKNKAGNRQQGIYCDKCGKYYKFITNEEAWRYKRQGMRVVNTYGDLSNTELKGLE